MVFETPPGSMQTTAETSNVSPLSWFAVKSMVTSVGIACRARNLLSKVLMGQPSSSPS